MEEALMMIQKLHSEETINDDQRDALKGKYISTETVSLKTFNSRHISTQSYRHMTI